ncbi:uncharacterized protein LOC131686796 [Topomyia yanbarensis]|uniref:uncharacterized protein LOC131686796 n=1 Tax=Topomyia yanbarensis TaxID=2498891 RepID=UPI00273B95C8|nr:uncharacterized protein LOC131686796 [Topomyia yanbarensis]
MAPPKGGARKKKPNDLLPKLEGHHEGPKFIILKRVDGSFEKVSPIIIHKGIKTICGEPLNTIKLRDGTLLVKTKNINQANQLLRCKMMFEMEITVEENIKLNQTKGIVTCADLKYATEEEILKELQEQGVCNVEVMKRKKDGILISTNSYVLTFKSNEIPESVKVGYLVLSVRLFIPRPLRCYKCQYFGHSSKFCSKEEVFETEQEITRIKVTENVSVREARQLYKIRFLNHTSTYSEVVSNSQEKNSNLKCTDDMPVVPSLNPLLPLQQMDTQSASTSTMDSGPVVDDNNRATSMDYQIAKISRLLSPDTGDLNEYENDIKRMRNTQSSLSGSSIVSADRASLSSNGL